MPASAPVPLPLGYPQFWFAVAVRLMHWGKWKLRNCEKRIPKTEESKTKNANGKRSTVGRPVERTGESKILANNAPYRLQPTPVGITSVLFEH